MRVCTTLKKPCTLQRAQLMAIGYWGSDKSLITLSTPEQIEQAAEQVMTGLNGVKRSRS